MDSNVFGGCGDLTALDLPQTLVNLGPYTFAYATQLTSVTLPRRMQTIDAFAFAECVLLTSITFPQNLTVISSSAFRGCYGLTSLKLPPTVTTVGASAFEGCATISSLTLPNGLDTVGANAFRNCQNLTSVVFWPVVSHTFIAWALGKSRHRSNWQITTLKHSQNLLRLIAEFSFQKGKKVNTLNPALVPNWMLREVDNEESGEEEYTARTDVFKGCLRLNTRNDYYRFM